MSRSGGGGGGGNFRDSMGNMQRSVPRSAPVLNTRGPAPSTRGFLSSTTGVSDAHFARKQREAEDVRHARMLQSILHRPYRASVGAFTNAKDHAFYSRTLAMRMKNARLYKEFRRQKDNLLLLQRLQQIHFYEHPSRTKIGKNYSKEWQQHQEKHDAARRRLTARPRMGNSLIFAKGNRESPLSPRNRVSWEGKRDHSYQDTTIYRDVNDPTSAMRERVGRAIGTSSTSHNSGMIFSRGRPSDKSPTSPSRDNNRLPSNAPDDRSSLAEKLAYERQRIEQELQKRWQAFGEENPEAHAYDGDEALAGEADEQYEEPDPALLEWERDLELPPEDVEDEGLSQLLRNRSGGYDGPNLPHPILQDYSNYHLPSFPVGVPSQPSYLPLSSSNNNPSQLTASGPYPPPPDTSRRQAMRARYIDEDESEVSELDDDDAGEQASGIASSALTSSNSRPSSASASQQNHRRRHSKRSSSGGSSGGDAIGNSRLYNLAMHSSLDEGDRELQAYRLHQWEMSLPPELRASMSQQQQQPHSQPPALHPHPPTSARSRPGSAHSTQQHLQQPPVSARSRPQSASQRSPRPTSASRESNELDDVLATLSAWDRDHETQSAAESLRIEALARQRNRDRELSYSANNGFSGPIDEGDERSAYANEEEEAAIRRARMKRGIHQQQQQQQRPRATSAAVSRGSAKKVVAIDRDLSEDAEKYFQQLKEEFPSSRRPAEEDEQTPSFLQDTFTTRVTQAHSKAQIAANNSRSRSKQSKNRIEPAFRPR